MTPDVHHAWSGDDWQDYCEELFRQKHSATGFVPVPDTDLGDLGMEGYSIDGSGIVYQCFASEATTVGRRYEAQRNKMTRDLKKLVDNEARVKALLGTVLVKVWVLMVPVHDSKELVMHARAKEQEMSGHGLSFVAPGFRVLIWTEADFAAERVALDKAGVASIPAASPMSAADVAASVAGIKREEGVQVAAMDGKLTRARAPDVADVRDRMLRRVVDGDNIRDHLRRDYPTTHEQILAELDVEERAILEARDFSQLHAGSVSEVRSRFVQRLVQTVPSIGADRADRLGHGAVGRWLLECPLDFPEPPAP